MVSNHHYNKKEDNNNNMKKKKNEIDKGTKCVCCSNIEQSNIRTTADGDDDSNDRSICVLLLFAKQSLVCKLNDCAFGWNQVRSRKELQKSRWNIDSYKEKYIQFHQFLQ